MENVMSTCWISSMPLWNKKRPNLTNEKVLFHQDIITVHTCAFVMAKCNDFLFLDLQRLLRRQTQTDKCNDQIITGTNCYFVNLSKSHYLEGGNWGNVGQTVWSSTKTTLRNETFLSKNLSFNQSDIQGFIGRNSSSIQAKGRNLL